VLDEVELLVAGLDGEIVAVGRLIRAFSAEGWIGEHHVVTLAAVGFVDGVAEINVRLDAVEKQIHQREPARARHEILADEGLRFDAPGVRAVEHGAGNVLGHKPFVTANEKAARAARRIANAEVRFAARIGFHHPNDGLDERAGREILARAFLAFAGGLFEQTLEGGAFYVHIHRRPVFLVNHGDDTLEIDGIVKAGRGLGEDVGKQAAGFTEFAQDVRVVIRQRGAGLRLERFPIAILRHFRVALIRHLEEQQVGQLFDIVAVVHAVMAQGMAEAPEFLNDVGHSGGKLTTDDRDDTDKTNRELRERKTSARTRSNQAGVTDSNCWT